MPAHLSVNLNAVAMLRNRRDLPWPSVTGLGAIALAAGAHGLTVHPRPDERHIRFNDLPAIRALIDDGFPDAEFNIEGYPTEEFLQLVAQNEPDQVTLVPDVPEQPTSDHGWDFAGQGEFLEPVVARLKKAGRRVSLFADPDPTGLDIAKAIGADRVEFYTGPYWRAYDDPARAEVELARLGAAADDGEGAGAPGQCRPRPDRREPSAARARDPRSGRGLHRPRADGRRADPRHGPDGEAVSQGVRVVAV